MSADKVIRSIEQSRREDKEASRRQLRTRLRWMTGLVVVVGIAGYLFLSQRPPIDVAVDIASPSARSKVTLRGLSRQPPPVVRAQLSSVVLNAGPAPGSGHDPGSELVELVIPVPNSACPRLVDSLGGACDDLRRPARRVQPPLIASWRDGATATVSATQPRRLELQPPAAAAGGPLASWKVDIAASRTTLTIDCAGASPLLLSHTGASPISTRCLEANPARWRLPVTFANGEPPSELDLIDPSSLQAQARGQTARLLVSDALLRVGDDPRHLKAKSGARVTMRSEHSGGVALDVAVTGKQAELSVEAGSASTVRTGDTEEIPSRFQRDEEIWLPVIFAVIGVLLTAWWDRLVLFR